VRDARCLGVFPSLCAGEKPSQCRATCYRGCGVRSGPKCEDAEFPVGSSRGVPKQASNPTVAILATKLTFPSPYIPFACLSGFGGRVRRIVPMTHALSCNNPVCRPCLSSPEPRPHSASVSTSVLNPLVWARPSGQPVSSVQCGDGWSTTSRGRANFRDRATIRARRSLQSQLSTGLR